MLLQIIEGVIDDESFDFIEQPAQKRIKTLKYLNSTLMGTIFTHPSTRWKIENVR